MSVLQKVKVASAKEKVNANDNSNFILGNNSFQVLDLIPFPVACVADLSLVACSGTHWRVLPGMCT
jgi:hypothetical protein